MCARDYRKIALDNVKINWKLSILAALIGWALSGLLVEYSVNLNFTWRGETYHFPSIQGWLLGTLRLGGILSIVGFVIGGVIRQGYVKFLMKQYDREELDIHDLFSQFEDFKRGFWLQLLQGLFVFLWMLLLIIPGIIAGFSYAMAPFIMAENPDMTPREALRASSDLMEGHRWELFCLRFSFIGWELLAGLTLGIGALFLNPYMNAAETAFYKELTKAPLQLPEA